MDLPLSPMRGSTVQVVWKKDCCGYRFSCVLYPTDHVIIRPHELALGGKEKLVPTDATQHQLALNNMLTLGTGDLKEIAQLQDTVTDHCTANVRRMILPCRMGVMSNVTASLADYTPQPKESNKMRPSQMEPRVHVVGLIKYGLIMGMHGMCYLPFRALGKSQFAGGLHAVGSGAERGRPRRWIDEVRYDTGFVVVVDGAEADDAGHHAVVRGMTLRRVSSKSVPVRWAKAALPSHDPLSGC